MNLQPAAQAEQERRTRSKLEPHRDAILTLRRKHWTYRQIAKWLNEHGVTVSHPAVYYFYERSIARRPRNAGTSAATIPDTSESQPLSLPRATTTTQNKTEPKKYRFNIEDL